MTPASGIIDYVNDTFSGSGSGSGSGFYDNASWFDNIFPNTSAGTLTTMGDVALTPEHYNVYGGVPFLAYDLGEMIVISILLGLLTLWTMFGNALVIISLFKFKPLRSMSNLLIGNLAVCDFLLALTVLPMSVVNDVLGHWVFGEVLCNLWLSTDVLYCTASIWSLCVIAMDRFTATTFPVWYRNRRSLKRAVTYMVIVWVFSAVVTVPPLFGWQDKSLNYEFKNATNTYMCVLFTNGEYVIYSASGSFIIPLFLQLALYAKIFTILRKRSKQLSRTYRKAPPKRPSADKAPPKLPPPREIELSTMSNKADDAKHLFSCDTESSPDLETKSDLDDDDDAGVAIIDGDHGLYSKHRETSSSLLCPDSRNGLLSTTDQATDSDTLVITNPTSRFTETDKESQSDQEKVTLMRKKPNHVRDSPNHSNKTKDGASKEAKKTQFSTAIKTVNPFKRDRMRTSLRKFDKREQRATQRMGIIITCFAVCWLPFLFMYLIRSLCASCPELNPNVQAFFIWLGYANSGLNPILYTIFNDDFRNAFYKLVCCCLIKRKPKAQHL